MDEDGAGNSMCHFHLKKERVLIVETLRFDDSIQLLSKNLNHAESTVFIAF